MSDYADVSFELKPEFLKVVHFIYRDQCNLQPGEKVLIVSDSHTPDHVVKAFIGVAFMLGAQAFNLRVPMGPDPAFQPGHSWDKLVVAAAGEANLIVDMAIGYAKFLVELTKEKGIRLIMPGDATGAPHIEDSLIRCLLTENPYDIKHQAEALTRTFSAGKTLHITSDEGTDYSLDIADLQASPFSGFLWDKAENRMVSNYEITPGGLPGFVIPKGRGDGVLAIDGLLLYQHVHARPQSPLLLTLEKGKIMSITGDRLIAGKLAEWLKSLGEDGCYFGPVHANLGLSKLARLTEHLEFERVRGAMVFGFGDNSILAPYYGSSFAVSESKVHWDAQILRTTLEIDGQVICKNGVVRE